FIVVPRPPPSSPLSPSTTLFRSQRPYGIIADPNDTPRAVFVSAFDSAPLAPDYNYVLADRMADLQKGIEAMQRLTEGKVHLSVRDRKSTRLNSSHVSTSYAVFCL